jgi:hypothetical protein
MKTHGLWVLASIFFVLPACGATPGAEPADEGGGEGGAIEPASAGGAGGEHPGAAGAGGTSKPSPADAGPADAASPAADAGRDRPPPSPRDMGSSARDMGSSPRDSAAASDAGPVSPALEAACTPATVTFMNQDPAASGGKVFADQVPDPEALVKQIARADCLTLYADAAAVKRITSITLVIESPGDGVAATGGNRVGFSAAYIGGLRGNVKYEIDGVLAHEIVHVYQNARGPGWMIEGMADFVRFRTGYFKVTNRRKGGNYDAAYQTTGFFLAWLDDQYPGFGRKLNAAMKTGASEQTFMDLTGKPVQQLWQEYQAAIP